MDPAGREEIRARVALFVETDAWVVDGNHRSTSQDLVWARADTVVWLDHPFWVDAGRSISRTGRRILESEELWGGNRETPARPSSAGTPSCGG
jgi:hypothetical protein